MRLQAPFQISARLMPALKIGDVWLSLDDDGGTTRDGRTVYRCYIDFPGGEEYDVDDLRSGCQGGSILEGFGALLSFLGAAAEAYNYRQRTGRPGENEDLFPPAIVEWASAHADELSMLALELEERGAELITE